MTKRTLACFIETNVQQTSVKMSLGSDRSADRPMMGPVSLEQEPEPSHETGNPGIIHPIRQIKEG